MESERLRVGYGHVPDAPPCPYCGYRYFMLSDTGDPVTLLVRCWCGATARVRRDDPDLAYWPGADPTPEGGFQ